MVQNLGKICCSGSGCHSCRLPRACIGNAGSMTRGPARLSLAQSCCCGCRRLHLVRQAAPHLPQGWAAGAVQDCSHVLCAPLPQPRRVRKIICHRVRLLQACGIPLQTWNSLTRHCLWILLLMGAHRPRWCEGRVAGCGVTTQPLQGLLLGPGE